MYQGQHRMEGNQCMKFFQNFGTTRCFSHTGSVNHEREEDPSLTKS